MTNRLTINTALETIKGAMAEHVSGMGTAGHATSQTIALAERVITEIKSAEKAKEFIGTLLTTIASEFVATNGARPKDHKTTDYTQYADKWSGGPVWIQRTISKVTAEKLGAKVSMSNKNGVIAVSWAQATAADTAAKAKDPSSIAVHLARVAATEANITTVRSIVDSWATLGGDGLDKETAIKMAKRAKLMEQLAKLSE